MNDHGGFLILKNPSSSTCGFDAAHSAGNHLVASQNGHSSRLRVPPRPLRLRGQSQLPAAPWPDRLTIDERRWLIVDFGESATARAIILKSNFPHDIPTPN
jgi:hypothetical protein